MVLTFFIWSGYLFEQVGSPYEGGIFRLKLEFPPKYPFQPPHVYFETKMFHPNISEKGTICLDILKQMWSPVLSVAKIILSISSLLTDPNPSDPLAPEVAALYRQDKAKFEQIARKSTESYAHQL